MKRLFILSLFVIPSLFAAESHRYIVATTQPARSLKLHALSNAAEARERNVRTFESIDGFAVDLTDAEAVEMRNSPGVRYVSRTIDIHAVGDITRSNFTPRPNGNPLAVQQAIPPNIDLVHARDVWPLTRGNNVNIVIFDTGVDLGHADLAANIAGGYNTFTKKDDFRDDNLHGTHVFGIIGALDNNIGVVGVAPGAHIYSVKVLDALGSGTDENLVAAADWVLAWKHVKGGNWIVSMSLGSNDTTPAETEAFRKLTDDGVLCVAASGNNGFDMIYPAALPDIVSVGAVDNDKIVADFSSPGPTLNVVAPGVLVLSTLPTGSVLRAATTLSNGSGVPSATIVGASFSDVTGEWVYCSYGGAGDFPPETRGRIAVIMRGMLISFSDKVRNAVAAGAIGAVIINNQNNSSTNWTLFGRTCTPTGCQDNPEDLAYPWPVVVAMSNADGAKLIADAKQQTITVSAYRDDYGRLSGTSMATPHVAGVAALVWSLAPSATARQVATALRATATDLGPPGADSHYGFGLIDARAAAQWLAPAAFGLPPRPATRQRGVHP
jgi:serine protease